MIILQKYLKAVDTKYAFEIAVELSENPEYHDSELGTRSAGSDAEHRTADRLASEMQKIGLKDVEKVGVSVDKFQFNGASIKLSGDTREIALHSYQQPGTPPQGITAEVVYVGKGTAADYENRDVKGKIVLFEVDQRANWWVTLPMLEAEVQGAVAALAAQSAGFSEISEDAYNANDIASSRSIPCLSITRRDAQYIQDKIKAGPVSATLISDTVYEPNGISYNVMGKIPGKYSDEMIVIGAHYDMYFKGFQDDSSGVASVLAIAKAMLDAGYQPQRDIYFVLHGAEEWGAANSAYDWTTGAWRMINDAHPEWVGKVLAFINFEMAAYEFAEYTSVYSAPELFTMIREFVGEKDTPKPHKAFPEGVKTAGYLTYTYSDDFSYYVAGVPSMINGFILQEDMQTVFPFYPKYYHSSFDTKDIYNENAMRFTIEFYGALAMYIDKTPVLQLDFSAQYDRLLAAIDEDTARKYNADYDGYKAAVDAYRVAAKTAFAIVQKTNAAKPDSAVWEEARKQNAANLALFKQTTDSLVSLMYISPIVPHEAPQRNLILIKNIIDCLNYGDVVTAINKYAWKINNSFESYALYFSPQVIAKFDYMLNSPENYNNRFWGRDREYQWAQTETATRGLMAKYKAETPDLSPEIAIYNTALSTQAEIYRNLVTKEITDIQQLTATLLIMNRKCDSIFV